MKKKRLLMIGFLAVFLTFSLCGLTYGGEGGNFRSGANVKVAADETIAGGLVAAGANVEILGKVQGDLKAFGANIVIPGEVQGEVKAFGANVTLSGTFDGDVEVGAARVTVARTAVIKGNLIHATADLNLQQGSRIMGEVIQKQVMVKKERVEKWGRRGMLTIIPIGIFFWLVSIAALIIVGLIINYLFPKKTNAVITAISQSFWKNLWFGLIFLVVVPVAIIIAFVTVVGIPAGVIAGLLYGIAIYISFIYIGVWIGRKVLGYIKKSMATAFFWPLVVGTIIIALINLIPIVGWLFRLCILLLSLGAMWATMWKTVPVPVKKKTQRKVQRKTRKKK
jgi:cytoskeletal protein CcmA (bactofilin family)